MRHLVIAAGILAIAAHAHAQTATAQSAPPPAEPATPALTKTVTVDPNDSPMVRAAKKAVASRLKNPAQRRVVSLNSKNTRGRFAVATGPVEGPKVPPMSPAPAPAARPSASQQEAAKRTAAVQKQMEKLQTEQEMLAAEMDEPYGGDLDEDQVEKRMYEAQAAQQKLQQTAPPPPPKP
jgi:hypothetical protein